MQWIEDSNLQPPRHLRKALYRGALTSQNWFTERRVTSCAPSQGRTPAGRGRCVGTLLMDATWRAISGSVGLWPQRRAQCIQLKLGCEAAVSEWALMAGRVYPFFLLSMEQCNFIGNLNVAIVVNVPHICIHPFYYLHYSVYNILCTNYLGICSNSYHNSKFSCGELEPSVVGSLSMCRPDAPCAPSREFLFYFIY